MSRFGSILCTTLVLILATGPADARQPTALQVGDGFQLGGVYFHVAAASEEVLLFRVSERLGAVGAAHHPDCFREGRTFYHVESCPLVQAHLARHGADAAPVATATTSGGGGSHPIDYLRGSYVPAARHAAWDWYGAPWSYAWAPLPFFHGPGIAIPRRHFGRHRPTPYGFHGWRGGFRHGRRGSFGRPGFRRW